MNQDTENLLNDFEEIPTVYGNFKQRAIAILLDGLILAPFAVLQYFNQFTWKSELILTTIFVIELVYKPFMEFQYGGTFGKMIMKLKVVNIKFLKADLKQVSIRNIFGIAGSIYSFVSVYMLFKTVEFATVTTNQQFEELQKKSTNLNAYLLIYFVIWLAEIIFLLSDDKKRSLHDRMGDTLVIKTQP